MKKIFIFITFFLCLFVAANVKAQTITPGPLVITYDGAGALFSEGNLSPGETVNKQLTVRNNGTVSHSFAIATNNVAGELGSIVTISAVVGGATIWTETVDNLQNLATRSKRITTLNAGQTKTINLVANFPNSSGSDLAGKSVSFDIVYGTEESEPTLGAESLTITPAPSVTPTVSVSASPEGEVKGEETGQGENGLNPWLLLIAPITVAASFIFLPEFAFAGGAAAISGGASLVLGYSFKGDMDPVVFYIILAIEVLALILISYFMLHHDNRASRRIRGYHHRLRIR